MPNSQPETRGGGHLVPMPTKRPTGAVALPAELLPPIIRAAGEKASRRFLEFFAASIRNPNTRKAYMHAVGAFFAWCEERGLALEQIEPLVVASYIEKHPASAPTVKQHLAGIRCLFDWLVVGQVIAVNPAASVKGPKHVTRTGKTPVLEGEQARTLLESIETGTVKGLRDRALIGVMVYSFGRIGAVVRLRCADYFQNGRRWWLRLHEKGGKRLEIPVHHKAEEYLDAYLEAAGIADDGKGFVFRSVDRSGNLTRSPLHPDNALMMVKARAIAAGLPESTCCHTFRATGITAYLSNGGSLENAQYIAGHASASTTKLYDRRGDKIALSEIERIVL